MGQLGQLLHDYFGWVRVQEAEREELGYEQYLSNAAYGEEEWGLRPGLLQELATAAMARLFDRGEALAAEERDAAGDGGTCEALGGDGGQGERALPGGTQGQHNSARAVLEELEGEVLRLMALLEMEERRAMDALTAAEMMPDAPGRKRRRKVLESRLLMWARIRQVVGRLCYRLKWGLEEMQHVMAEALAEEAAAAAAGKGQEGEGGGAAEGGASAVEAAAASAGPPPVRYTLVRRMLRVVVERRRRRERQRQEQQPQEEEEGLAGERAGSGAAADSGAATGVGYRACGLSPDLRPLADGVMLELLESGLVQGDSSRGSLVQEQVAAAAPTAGADPWVEFRLGTLTRADASALQREVAWLGQERSFVREQQERKQEQQQAVGKGRGNKAEGQGAGKGRATAGHEQRAEESGAEAVASAAGEDVGQGSAAGAGLEGLPFTARDFRMALRAAEAVLVACRTCAHYGLEAVKKEDTASRELVEVGNSLQRLYGNSGAGLDSPLPMPFAEPAAHKFAMVQMYGSLCISALVGGLTASRNAWREVQVLGACAVPCRSVPRPCCVRCGCSAAYPSAGPRCVAMRSVLHSALLRRRICHASFSLNPTLCPASRTSLSPQARRRHPRRLARDQLEHISLCAVQAIREAIPRAPQLSPQAQDSEANEAQQQRGAGGRKMAMFLGLCLKKEPDAANSCADVVDKLHQTAMLNKSPVSDTCIMPLVCRG